MSTYSSPQQRGLDLLTIVIDELIDELHNQLRRSADGGSPDARGVTGRKPAAESPSSQGQGEAEWMSQATSSTLSGALLLWLVG